MSPRSVRRDLLLAGVAPSDLDALREGRHAEPHRVLGPHAAKGGVVVRAFHPDAVTAECLVPDESPQPMTELGGGLFALQLPTRDAPPARRLRFHFASGESWERGDPYGFAPLLGELDLHLFGEGRHRRLWEVMGAHPRELDGVAGTGFAVWAPNARRVSVVGDFCGWDGRLLPMRVLGSSGVFELFVPGLGPGTLYKFEILTREGALRLKTDPYALSMEMPPETASRVVASDHAWRDKDWMEARARRNHAREPMAVYEVHLGSWARGTDGQRLGYRELAPRIADHVRRLGFTHIELLPVAEHAFYGSWGYQVTGYFAPTARYGSPDDFRYFVDTCHERGIGVLLDWVPAHFPRDDFSLRRFDGSPLYEHEDPRRGEHPDWGTLVFNFGRNEVRNFLVANALYWLDEFHVDGLRVDAVASMLYLDYSRKAGQWVPNRFGGRHDLEAISFLKECNRAIHETAPGAMTVAEESTAFAGVTVPASEGGLGFDFKWNMGWMHDTLAYFGFDPVHRSHHHDQLTFAMLYEFSERFVNALSHDEVVHGKGSMLRKMPGDPWQKLANLRALLAYQYTRPGKILLFMGIELAPEREWNHDAELEWALAEDPARAGLARLFEDLGRLYAETSCFWRRDPDPESFAWIDCADRGQSIYVYERRDADAHAVVVLNLTPVPREDYRIGAPRAGVYVERLSTDAARYGGSGFATSDRVETEPVACHGREHSLRLRLPPLAALVLVPAD